MFSDRDSRRLKTLWKQTFFALSKSRSETPLVPNGNGVLFWQNDKKVLQNHYDLQRFQDAIPDLRKMMFSHWKSQQNGNSKSRSGIILFSNENGSDSCKNTKNCTPKLLCFTTFSERNSRLTGNEVFPLEKSTKLVIEIAFWNPFVC